MKTKALDGRGVFLDPSKELQGVLEPRRYAGLA
jgi:hypothetical protein